MDERDGVRAVSSGRFQKEPFSNIKEVQKDHRGDLVGNYPGTISSNHHRS